MLPLPDAARAARTASGEGRLALAAEAQAAAVATSVRQAEAAHAALAQAAKRTTSAAVLRSQRGSGRGAKVSHRSEVCHS
mgnify:CR=1 FL=1